MAEQKKLTLCIIVKDDESRLPSCLTRMEGAVDEILIADIGSGGHTAEAAMPFGAAVYRPDWEDDFSKVRNFCMAHASGDWVLFLQADETISSGHMKEVRILMQNPAAEGYLLCVDSGAENPPETCPADELRLLRRRKNYRFRCRSYPYIPDEEMYAVLSADVSVTRSGDAEAWQAAERSRLLAIDMAEHPQDGYIRYLNGIELLNQGRYEESAASFEFAHHAFTGGYLYTPHLYKCLGICFLALCRHQAAEEVLNEGAWLFPFYTDLGVLRAQLHRQLGMDAEAMEDLGTCLTVLSTPNAYVPRPGIEISVVADMLNEIRSGLEQRAQE